MAVVFDAVTSTTVQVATYAAPPSLTISGASNRAVAAGFTSGASTAGLACTIGGESLTLITGTDNTTGFCNSALLGKATTLTGSQAVVFSWTNAGDAVVGAMSFINVDQTTPFNNGSNGGDNSNYAPTVTSASGDLTFTIVQSNSSAASLTSGQTSQWSLSPRPSGTRRGAGDTGPGTVNPTHTWAVSPINDITGGSAANAKASLAPSIAASGQPIDQNTVIPNDTTVSVTAVTSGGALTYQWQKQEYLGSFANIGGATSSSYTISASAGTDMRDQYRCIVTDSNGSTTSNAATLTVREYDVFLWPRPDSDAVNQNVWLRDPTKGVGYNMPAGVGTFTLTGAASNLLWGHVVTATVGTYTLTGNASILEHGYKFAAAVGTFTLGGIAASLRADRLLSNSVGVFALSGQPAILEVGRVLATQVGTFLFTGIDANLVYTPSGPAAYMMAADTGVFTLSGIGPQLIYGSLPTGRGLGGDDAPKKRKKLKRQKSSQEDLNALLRRITEPASEVPEVGKLRPTVPSPAPVVESALPTLSALEAAELDDEEAILALA